MSDHDLACRAARRGWAVGYVRVLTRDKAFRCKTACKTKEGGAGNLRGSAAARNLSAITMRRIVARRDAVNAGQGVAARSSCLVDKSVQAHYATTPRRCADRPLPAVVDPLVCLESMS